MDADVFKDIIVPVIGGLGIFMLGLEFMERGIQALSANKMKELMTKMAGSPAKGVLAGTVITGVIQSSTAMTVMTVGLVNAGILTLRGAIGVIMGANIGTTLGNGLIALPLGPIGLLFGGAFALLYVFGRSARVKNIALACMGFSLIFHGLNLMTGGLKPLREMPVFMDLISGLDSSTFIGVIGCAVIAALITAAIHSSSATIGIVRGLGVSGILEWQTAIAFAIGADLGTTITSWIASLNLSKNAKRTAYAHIGFNFIGVTVVLALFFPAIALLEFLMKLFVGDPGAPVVVDGQETFPLVPVAVVAFSIFFNIFNVVILFPFVNVFEKVLTRIGHSSDEDLEDYSVSTFLDGTVKKDISRALPAMQNEAKRLMTASAVFLGIARGDKDAPKSADEHLTAVDGLARQIRDYAAEALQGDVDREQMNEVADLIEEVDYTGSLNEGMHQVARRLARDEFSEAGRSLLDEGLGALSDAIEEMTGPLPADVAAAAGEDEVDASAEPDTAVASPVIGAAATFEALRWRVIDAADVPSNEKPAILALVGSMSRNSALAARIASLRETLDGALERPAQVVDAGAGADGGPQTA